MIQTIPQVKQIRYLEGACFLPDVSSDILLRIEEKDPRLVDLASRLFPGQSVVCEQLEGVKGYTFSIQGLNGTELLRELRLEDQREGYVLRMENASVTIAAAKAAGLFYGIQTLRQIMDNHDSIPAAVITDWPDVGLRCMNFDLRQTFSKPEKLLAYIAEFAKFKVNGLLIEYEDKLPYERYQQVCHPNFAFSREQFEMLKETAKNNFIEIIPLQQSFGHLDYVLRYDAYKWLREIESSTGELCPSRPESYELATGLLDEMIAMHPDSRYIHLGCDEVYSLCECETCRDTYQGAREKTFIAFVNRLIAYAAGKGKTPIIWHDMLKKCSEEDLKLLDKRAAVMIWIYNGRNIDSDVSRLTATFRNAGFEVMGAPAVRCFDDQEHQNYPVVASRIDNVLQWSQTSGKLGIDCVVATNWSTSFSFGLPYGIFETTWYLMALFADVHWNREADTGRFVDRFLRLFHGVDQETAKNKLGNYLNEDYYLIIGSLLDEVVKHKDVAELIGIMNAFEHSSDRMRTIHKYLYRWELFPGDEAEWQSLLSYYQRNTAGRTKVRPQMSAILRHFQPEEMADHFVMSRFYLHDYLEKNVYSKMGLSLA
ncbi:glycoside hydrolase family 20 zincin-like fold domain-containing protein [Paenibacillus sp. 2RAB27]|uniref:glycoside hydrolase family 20 zincin-like fold domain-containing protein n=1 Tax=Paenibacillus sp. 2RAB27 TaxID=3232991 RepID=UPI003F946205